MDTKVSSFIERAARLSHRPRIVVAAADDENALETVYHARKQGLIEAVLVGPKKRIKKLAQELSIDVSGLEIVDAGTPETAVENALRFIKDGSCDILMKGAVPTGDLMKKVVEKEYGLRTNRILSHVGLFDSPEGSRLTLLTDAGVNIAPDVARKRDIIINAVNVLHQLGNPCPRVAVLSFVEKVRYPSVRSTADAAILTEMNKNGAISGCIVRGPLALDNAVSEESARIKGIEGEVAGRADIIVAHDINMGNAIYKALQVWVGAVIAALVVGSTTPIVVPSRADSMESKLHSIALAILLRETLSSGAGGRP